MRKPCAMPPERPSIFELYAQTIQTLIHPYQPPEHPCEHCCTSTRREKYCSDQCRIKARKIRRILRLVHKAGMD